MLARHVDFVVAPDPLEIGASLMFKSSMKADPYSVYTVYDCGVWLGENIEEYVPEVYDISSKIHSSSSLYSSIKSLSKIKSSMLTKSDSKALINTLISISSKMYSGSSTSIGILNNSNISSSIMLKSMSEVNLKTDIKISSSISSACRAYVRLTGQQDPPLVSDSQFITTEEEEYILTEDSEPLTTE